MWRNDSTQSFNPVTRSSFQDTHLKCTAGIRVSVTSRSPLTLRNERYVAATSVCCGTRRVLYISNKGIEETQFQSRGRLRSEAKRPHAPLRQSNTNTAVLIKTALLSGQLVGAACRSDSYKLERNILDGQNALPGFSKRHGFQITRSVCDHSAGQRRPCAVDQAEVGNLRLLHSGALMMQAVHLKK